MCAKKPHTNVSNELSVESKLRCANMNSACLVLAWGWAETTCGCFKFRGSPKCMCPSGCSSKRTKRDFMELSKERDTQTCWGAAYAISHRRQGYSPDTYGEGAGPVTVRLVLLIDRTLCFMPVVPVQWCSPMTTTRGKRGPLCRFDKTFEIVLEESLDRI